MLLIAEVKPALPVADARVSFSVPDVTFWAEVLLATALSPANTPAPVIASPTTAMPTPSSSGTARRRLRSSVWVSSGVTANLLGSGRDAERRSTGAASGHASTGPGDRSEERRVGKEGRARWAP